MGQGPKVPVTVEAEGLEGKRQFWQGGQSGWRRWGLQGNTSEDSRFLEGELEVVQEEGEDIGDERRGLKEAETGPGWGLHKRGLAMSLALLLPALELSN